MSITDTEATQVLNGTLPPRADPLLIELSRELHALAADLTATEPSPRGALIAVLAGGPIPSAPGSRAHRLPTRMAIAVSGLGLGAKLALAAGAAAAALAGAQLSDDLPHPLQDLVDRIVGEDSAPPSDQETDLPQHPQRSDEATPRPHDAKPRRSPGGAQHAGRDAGPDRGKDQPGRQEAPDGGDGEAPDEGGTVAPRDGTSDEGTDDDRTKGAGPPDRSAPEGATQPDRDHTDDNPGGAVDNTEPATGSADDNAGG